MSKTKNINLELTTDPQTYFEDWRKTVNGEGTAEDKSDYSNAQLIDEAIGKLTSDMPVANPEGAATDDLNTIQIGSVIYNIKGSGGGGVVEVEALPASPSTGNIYKLTTDGSVWSYFGTSWVRLDNVEELPSGGTKGQLLSVTYDDTGKVRSYEWIDAPISLPTGGTDGQILTRKVDGETVTAEWEDAPISLPEGGTDGQVLTRVVDSETGEKSAEWKDAQGGGGDANIVEVDTLPEASAADIKTIYKLKTNGSTWTTKKVTSGEETTYSWLRLDNVQEVPDGGTNGQALVRKVDSETGAESVEWSNVGTGNAKIELVDELPETGETDAIYKLNGNGEVWTYANSTWSRLDNVDVINVVVDAYETFPGRFEGKYVTTNRRWKSAQTSFIPEITSAFQAYINAACSEIDGYSTIYIPDVLNCLVENKVAESWYYDSDNNKYFVVLNISINGCRNFYYNGYSKNGSHSWIDLVSTNVLVNEYNVKFDLWLVNNSVSVDKYDGNLSYINRMQLHEVTASTIYLYDSFTNDNNFYYNLTTDENGTTFFSSNGVKIQNIFACQAMYSSAVNLMLSSSIGIYNFNASSDVILSQDNKGFFGNSKCLVSYYFDLYDWMSVSDESTDYAYGKISPIIFIVNDAVESPSLSGEDNKALFINEEDVQIAIPYSTDFVAVDDYVDIYAKIGNNNQTAQEIYNTLNQLPYNNSVYVISGEYYCETYLIARSGKNEFSVEFKDENGNSGTLFTVNYANGTGYYFSVYDSDKLGNGEEKVIMSVNNLSYDCYFEDNYYSNVGMRNATILSYLYAKKELGVNTYKTINIDVSEQINEAVGAEQARAVIAETALKDKIDNEQVRAILKEEQIETEVGKKISTPEGGTNGQALLKTIDATTGEESVKWGNVGTGNAKIELVDELPETGELDSIYKIKSDGTVWSYANSTWTQMNLPEDGENDEVLTKHVNDDNSYILTAKQFKFNTELTADEVANILAQIYSLNYGIKAQKYLYYYVDSYTGETAVLNFYYGTSTWSIDLQGSSSSAIISSSTKVWNTSEFSFDNSSNCLNSYWGFTQAQYEKMFELGLLIAYPEVNENIWHNPFEEALSGSNGQVLTVKESNKEADITTLTKITFNTQMTADEVGQILHDNFCTITTQGSVWVYLIGDSLGVQFIVDSSGNWTYTLAVQDTAYYLIKSGVSTWQFNEAFVSNNGRSNGKLTQEKFDALVKQGLIILPDSTKEIVATNPETELPVGGEDGQVLTRSITGTIIKSGLYINTLYFDTSLSTNQVVSILEKADLPEFAGAKIYMIACTSITEDEEGVVFIYAIKQDSVWAITECVNVADTEGNINQEEITLFTSTEGWAEDFNGEIEINTTMAENYYGVSLHENVDTYKLVYIDETSVDTEWTTVIPSGAKADQILVNRVYNSPVPTDTGDAVNVVYFNKSKSPKEVYTFFKDKMYSIGDISSIYIMVMATEDGTTSGKIKSLIAYITETTENTKFSIYSLYGGSIAPTSSDEPIIYYDITNDEGGFSDTFVDNGYCIDCEGWMQVSYGGIGAQDGSKFSDIFYSKKGGLKLQWEDKGPEIPTTGEVGQVLAIKSVSEGKKAITPGEYVDTIYFNTSMSDSEVQEFIDGITDWDTNSGTEYATLIFSNSEEPSTASVYHAVILYNGVIMELIKEAGTDTVSNVLYATGAGWTEGFTGEIVTDDTMVTQCNLTGEGAITLETAPREAIKSLVWVEGDGDIELEWVDPQEAVAEEQTRAVIAESAISGKLNDEQVRAILKEGQIESEIVAETNRATEKEAQLEKKIGTGGRLEIIPVVVDTTEAPNNRFDFCFVNNASKQERYSFIPEITSTFQAYIDAACVEIRENGYTSDEDILNCLVKNQVIESWYEDEVNNAKNVLLNVSINNNRNFTWSGGGSTWSSSNKMYFTFTSTITTVEDYEVIFELGLLEKSGDPETAYSGNVKEYFNYMYIQSVRAVGTIHIYPNASFYWYEDPADEGDYSGKYCASYNEIPIKSIFLYCAGMAADLIIGDYLIIHNFGIGGAQTTGMVDGTESSVAYTCDNSTLNTEDGHNVIWYCIINNILVTQYYDEEWESTPPLGKDNSVLTLKNFDAHIIVTSNSWMTSYDEETGQWVREIYATIPQDNPGNVYNTFCSLSYIGSVYVIASSYAGDVYLVIRKDSDLSYSLELKEEDGTVTTLLTVVYNKTTLTYSFSVYNSAKLNNGNEAKLISYNNFNEVCDIGEYHYEYNGFTNGNLVNYIYSKYNVSVKTYVEQESGDYVTVDEFAEEQARAVLAETAIKDKLENEIPETITSAIAEEQTRAILAENVLEEKVDEVLPNNTASEGQVLAYEQIPAEVAVPTTGTFTVQTRDSEWYDNLSDEEISSLAAKILSVKPADSTKYYIAVDDRSTGMGGKTLFAIDFTQRDTTQDGTTYTIVATLYWDAPSGSSPWAFELEKEKGTETYQFIFGNQLSWEFTKLITTYDGQTVGANNEVIKELIFIEGTKLHPTWSDSLTKETARATAAEETLQESIGSEQTRAVIEETAIKDEISNSELVIFFDAHSAGDYTISSLQANIVYSADAIAATVDRILNHKFTNIVFNYTDKSDNNIFKVLPAKRYYAGKESNLYIFFDSFNSSVGEFNLCFYYDETDEKWKFYTSDKDIE